MNTCKHCNVELTQDNWRFMGRKRPAYTCRVCEREQANSRKKAIREYVAYYKRERGCYNCGYNEHHYALDLAHRDRAEKTNSYKSNTSAYNPNWSLDRLKQELEKCDVLCSNCHRVETAIESGWLDYD